MDWLHVALASALVLQSIGSLRIFLRTRDALDEIVSESMATTSLLVSERRPAGGSTKNSSVAESEV